MKTIILTFTLLLSSIVFSQSIPNKDTIKSIFLLSQYQSSEKVFFSLFKRCHDVGIIINIDDKDVFIFDNGHEEYFGKITQFNFDSDGHIHVYFTITHKRGVGKVSIDSKICFTYGDDFFTMVIDNKSRKHTKIKYKFHKEKFFNVDFI